MDSFPETYDDPPVLGEEFGYWKGQKKKSEQEKPARGSG